MCENVLDSIGKYLEFGVSILELSTIQICFIKMLLHYLEA
jgi:hypothetical protein